MGEGSIQHRAEAAPGVPPPAAKTSTSETPWGRIALSVSIVGAVTILSVIGAVYGGNLTHVGTVAGIATGTLIASAGLVVLSNYLGGAKDTSEPAPPPVTPKSLEDTLSYVSVIAVPYMRQLRFLDKIEEIRDVCQKLERNSDFIAFMRNERGGELLIKYCQELTEFYALRRPSQDHPEALGAQMYPNKVQALIEILDTIKDITVSHESAESISPLFKPTKEGHEGILVDIIRGVLLKQANGSLSIREAQELLKQLQTIVPDETFFLIVGEVKADLQ